MNPTGEVFLVEPKGHYGNVSATFPKVSLKPGERPSGALARCLREKIGQAALSAYPVPGVWKTPNTTSVFFAGFVSDGEIAAKPTSPFLGITGWCCPELAGLTLEQSPNIPSRERDLAMLGQIQKLCLYPGRRVLLMVQELHRLGFERLRAAPYLAPSGCNWRCTVLPITCLSSKHGAYPVSYGVLEQRIGNPQAVFRYTDGQRQAYFGWEDAAFDSPAELASKFLSRTREIAFAGWGPDPDYVRWYEVMLTLTAPNGVPYAFADYKNPTDRLYVMLKPDVRQVPLPPPGHALPSSEDEWFTAE